MALIDKSYRAKEAAELLGIGVSTLWRWVKEKPDFPQPIALSPRCTVLRGGELIAWRDAQAQKSAARPQRHRTRDVRVQGVAE